MPIEKGKKNPFLSCNCCFGANLAGTAGAGLWPTAHVPLLPSWTPCTAEEGEAIAQTLLPFWDGVWQGVSF